MRRYRELPPTLDQAVKTLAIALIVISALFSLGVPSALGLSYFPQQFLGFVLGATLAIVFVLLPPRRGRTMDRLPWYDAVLALLGIVIGIYIIVWYPKIAYEITFPTPDKYLLGTLAMVLVLEACRRIYGLVLPVVALLFVGNAAFASYFPGVFRARSIPWTRLATELYLGPEGILGVALMVVATVVLVFVLFGQLLFAMGGGDVFTDVASALMGRFRGGPAKVAVLGSALFGSISGSGGRERRDHRDGHHPAHETHRVPARSRGRGRGRRVDGGTGRSTRDERGRVLDGGVSADSLRSSRPRGSASRTSVFRRHSRSGGSRGGSRRHSRDEAGGSA